MAAKRLSRRTILSAAGVSIPLPLLDAMSYGREVPDRGGADPRKRMVLVSVPLGLHAPFFFPEGEGKSYRPSRYLEHLESLRGDWTVISGVSHHYGGGHGTRAGLMTGVAPQNMRPGKVRNSISLDQEVAARVTFPVRYPNLTLGHTGLSWNAKGVVIPAESNPGKMFQRLFVEGSPDQMAKEMGRIQHGQSILDGVRQQAAELSRQVGTGDRRRIDLMMTSIREAERLLQQDLDWVAKPKPSVDAEPITDRRTGIGLIERQEQWFNLVHLALQTDSTRVVSLNFHSHHIVPVDGQQIPHHDASHHGRDEDKIEKLAKIEEAEIKAFAGFLEKLKATQDGEASLLDRTQVFFASDLGNASAHTTDNLPVLLAGGGFRHTGHQVFDRKNNTSLSNLFVRMMQQMGIEAEQFGNSTGVMSEL